MEIFVSNLPHSAKLEEIEALFASFGKVEKIKMLNDKISGKPRGMAFVMMAEDVEIKPIVEAMNGFEMQGRKLKVEKARSRTSKSGGFNGFRAKTAFDPDRIMGKKRFSKDGKSFSRGFHKKRSSFSKRKFTD